MWLSAGNLFVLFFLFLFCFCCFILVLFSVLISIFCEVPAFLANGTTLWRCIGHLMCSLLRSGCSQMLIACSKDI